MIIEKKKIQDLIPAPYNPRQSTKKQEEKLKESLVKFGVVEPVVFNKRTGFIVGGHFRVRELQKLGYKEIECVIVDLSEDDEKELNIRLNANTGGWDWDSLGNNFDASQLSEWGLEVLDLEVKESVLSDKTNFSKKKVLKIEVDEHDYDEILATLKMINQDLGQALIELLHRPIS